ncbi:MAG TPA: hypothetical protein VJT74_14400 [Pyrinomonadaceae bacterium]|nr:hypothetical protein [Pyrinomonadaceae bacterium]
MRSVSLTVALLCAASIVLADVKITTKSSAGGQSMTTTTYIKGSRQRTEGMGYTSIYQCDLKRSIQINDKTKTYMITPLAGANAGAAVPVANGQAAGKARKGGVVTYTTSATDTGERKQVMGLTARHIKSKVVIAASEGACNPMNMEMETDGWYVDLPGGMDCAADGKNTPVFPVDQSECVDEVRFKTEGNVKLGYPVETTTKMKFNTGDEVEAIATPTSSSAQEVVNISTATLDASLFDVPAGYTEVKTIQELGSPY